MLGEAVIGPAKCEAGPVKLGLRPEHLFVDPQGPLEAMIQMSEPLGANTLLHGRLTQSDAPVTISLPGVHAISDRSSGIRLAIWPDNMHLFDPVSGQRR